MSRTRRLHALPHSFMPGLQEWGGGRVAASTVEEEIRGGAVVWFIGRVFRGRKPGRCQRGRCVSVCIGREGQWSENKGLR
jgi:hypothetical protein